MVRADTAYRRQRGEPTPGSEARPCRVKVQERTAGWQEGRGWTPRENRCPWGDAQSVFRRVTEVCSQGGWKASHRAQGPCPQGGRNLVTLTERKRKGTPSLLAPPFPAGVSYSTHNRNQKARDRVETGHKGQPPGHTAAWQRAESW